MARVLSLLLLILCIIGFVGCSQETHYHTFSGVWSSDEVYHWHAATCGHDVVSEKSEHYWDNGTVLKYATESENGEIEYKCQTCGYIRKEVVSFDEMPSYYSQFFVVDDNGVL